MLVRDIMTKEVITIPANMPIAEAKKLMKERKVSRLPVVEDGKLLGLVNEDRLESVAYSRSKAPVVWQIQYLLSHTTVKDVMVRDVATCSPDTTVEQSVAIAQPKRIGSLVVVDKNNKVVGILTTTDFFNGIVDKVLGIGKPGTRLYIPGAGDGPALEKVLAAINKAGIEVVTLFTISPPRSRRKDLVIHLETARPKQIMEEIKTLGFEPSIRAR